MRSSVAEKKSLRGPPGHEELSSSPSKDIVKRALCDKIEKQLPEGCSDD